MKLGSLRPLNGWRDFAGEVGVIVLGVLIALGAQQLAESVNERREAADAHAAVIAEIRETLTTLELRRAATPCVKKRLKELRALVDQWGRTGTFNTPSWVAQAPSFVSTSARFEAAQAAGRLAMLPKEEQYRVGLIANTLRSFREIQQNEQGAWARLRMLQSGSDALSPSDRTAIRLALQEASFLNYRAEIATGQGLTFAASYGWRPDHRRLQIMARRSWKNGKFTPSICYPIDTPPEVANENQLFPVPE